MNGDMDLYENIALAHTEQQLQHQQQQSPRKQDVKQTPEVVALDVYKELEEEHEVLTAELQRVALENKHLKEQADKQQTSRDQYNSHVPAPLPMDADDVTETVQELEKEISQLKQQLEENKQRHDAAVAKRLELHDVNDVSMTDSWQDSGDEGERGESRQELEKQIAVLKSQVLELTHVNQELLRAQNKVRVTS